MSSFQFAWIMYFLGAAGCSLVAWWMFSWAPRFVRYSAVATTLVLLLVPFTVDKEAGTLAPALFAVVFEGMTQGAAAMERPLKLLLGIWAMVEILLAAYVYLTRKNYLEKHGENFENQQQVQVENSDLNIGTSQTEGSLGESQEINSFDQTDEHETDVLTSSEMYEADDLNEPKPKNRKKPSVSKSGSKKASQDTNEANLALSEPDSSSKNTSSKSTKARGVKEEPIRAIRD